MIYEVQTIDSTKWESDWEEVSVETEDDLGIVAHKQVQDLWDYSGIDIVDFPIIVVFRFEGKETRFLVEPEPEMHFVVTKEK